MNSMSVYPEEITVMTSKIEDLNNALWELHFALEYVKKSILLGVHSKDSAGEYMTVVFFPEDIEVITKALEKGRIK